MFNNFQKIKPTLADKIFLYGKKIKSVYRISERVTIIFFEEELSDTIYIKMNANGDIIYFDLKELELEKFLEFFSEVKQNWGKIK